MNTSDNSTDMRGQCSCGTLQHKSDCLMLCLRADSSTSAAHQMMRLTCRARVGQQHTAAAHSSSTQQHSSSTQQHTATAHSSNTQQNTAAHSRTHTVSRLTTMVTQCVYKLGQTCSVPYCCNYMSVLETISTSKESTHVVAITVTVIRIACK